MGNQAVPFDFMKGIIYTRVSSDEQIKGTSLDSQEKICRQYCDDKGIEVLAVFREEGASAKSADREEFLRAIEYCRKNKGSVDVFVVAKVDRFARNTEDHFYVRKILIDYGVSLHSVTEPIGNTPTEKFIETVLAGSAEFDNAIRRQRCVDGMIARLKQGIHPTRPPIGYVCGNFKRRGLKKTEPDPPDGKIFAILQKGLQEYSKGGISQVELAALYDKWGLGSLRGKKTTNKFVNGLLTKNLSFYAGILNNALLDEEVEGLHEPMITKEEYHRIRLILSGKSGKLSKPRHYRYNPTFPLRKTVLCAHCGRPLTGSCSIGNGGKYPYYHCYNKDCATYGKIIPKEELEKKFMDFLYGIVPKEKFLQVFTESVLNLWQEEGLSFKLEAERHKKRLTALEEKRKRIFEMREDGSYARNEFRERKEEVENEIAAAKISLSEARIEQFNIEAALSYANQFIRNLGRQWFDLTQSHNRFQKLVLPEGISYDRKNGFGTAKLGLIFEMNRQCADKKSLIVDCAGLEPATSAVQKRRSTR